MILPAGYGAKSRNTERIIALFQIYVNMMRLPHKACEYIRKHVADPFLYILFCTAADLPGVFFSSLPVMLITPRIVFCKIGLSYTTLGAKNESAARPEIFLYLINFLVHDTITSYRTNKSG